MTWLAVPLLALGVAAIRLGGMFVAGPVLQRHPLLIRLSSLIPVAVVAALVTQLGFLSGGSFVVDERAVGLLAAAILVWRRAPFPVIIVAAAAVTALVRLF